MQDLVRETEADEEPEAPDSLAALSFSDGDLNAFEAGWRRADGGLPPLRLANLTALTAPAAADAFIERTLGDARAILIRLTGGLRYWDHGAKAVADLARRRKIALAILPADGRPDAELDALSTLPVSTLRRLQRLCDEGGAVAAEAALSQLALAGGIYAGPVRGAKTLPPVGAWTPELGAACPLAARDWTGARPAVAIVFYRAHLAAADIAPLDALFRALEARGLAPVGLFAPTLKTPEAARWLARWIRAFAPAAIVNATAFSARGEDGSSPLDATDAPVFQVALAASGEAEWAEADHGLSPADLAMYVALPEAEGRIFAGVASFRAAPGDESGQKPARMFHSPRADRIDMIADRVKAWAGLGAKPAAERRAALVLSAPYGAGWRMTDAGGLDPFASAEAILQDMAGAGADAPPGAPLAEALATERIAWPIGAYRAALAALPAALRRALDDAWGDPEDDPLAIGGAFRFAAVRRGAQLAAVRPDSGLTEAPGPAAPPRHGYVAFHLWLRSHEKADVVIAVGAGLAPEWLPGKAVALSRDCWPEALTGATPVIRLCAEGDLGGAALARRRTGAVALSCRPAPLATAGAPDSIAKLAAAVDELSAGADSPRLRRRLKAEVLREARAACLGPLGEDGKAVEKIRRFVGDVRESAFRDGLRVWGRAPSSDEGADGRRAAETERAALIGALNGRRSTPPEGGDPCADPLSLPTRDAHDRGVKLAEALIRRLEGDAGAVPRRLILSLGDGGATRSVGEEFAMALHLIGAAPRWDESTGRASGFDILPLAALGRPRIDATLLVSGLFRDFFPTLAALFQQAADAAAARDETLEMNPLAETGAAGARVYGPPPGAYGPFADAAMAEGSAENRRRFGEAWLAAASWTFGATEAARDEAGIAARVRGAEAFVQSLDLPGADLLALPDHARQAAGFTAAQAVTGGKAERYVIDNAAAGEPGVRTLSEEIARAVHARAANPRWIEGMMRHGRAGASAIAETLARLAALARHTGEAEGRLLRICHEATLGDAKVAAFMAAADPAAFESLRKAMSGTASESEDGSGAKSATPSLRLRRP